MSLKVDLPAQDKPKERDPKRPFDWQFLHPKYWGIWLAFALILPLIYLPLRWQFWLGKQLGILIYRIAGSRRRDTLVNLIVVPDNLLLSVSKWHGRSLLIKASVCLKPYVRGFVHRLLVILTPLFRDWLGIADAQTTAKRCYCSAGTTPCST